jgi:hypothetical protein
MAAFAASFRCEVVIDRKAAFRRANALPSLPPNFRSKFSVLGEATLFSRDALVTLPRDCALLLRIHRGEPALTLGVLFHALESLSKSQDKIATFPPPGDKLWKLLRATNRRLPLQGLQE